MENKKNQGKQKKKLNTQASKRVSHTRTDCALPFLTSAFGWEPVLVWWCGRVEEICDILLHKFTIFKRTKSESRLTDPWQNIFWTSWRAFVRLFASISCRRTCTVVKRRGEFHWEGGGGLLCVRFPLVLHIQKSIFTPLSHAEVRRIFLSSCTVVKTTWVIFCWVWLDLERRISLDFAQISEQRLNLSRS